MPTTSDQQSNTAAPIRFIVDEPGIDTEFGIKGRGYSPDNGQHFFVQNTTKGRIFRLLDAQRLYPLLKPMFDQVYGGPVETSLHWVDILDKPDLVLKSDLPDLSIYALKKDVPSVDGFLKLSDLAGYARLSDIPSLDGYVKTSDLPDMTAYYTKTDTDSKLSSKADVSSLNAVKSTAESASSTASSAQEASQEAQSTASSASNTASSAYLLASSANSKVTQLESRIDQIGKIDSSNQYRNKLPSEYSEGIFYEIKNPNYIGIYRSDMDSSAQPGSTAIVTTKKYGQMARQTAEVLDNQRPVTFMRNGYSNSWSTWESVTTW